MILTALSGQEHVVRDRLFAPSHSQLHLANPVTRLKTNLGKQRLQQMQFYIAFIAQIDVLDLDFIELRQARSIYPFFRNRAKSRS